MRRNLFGTDGIRARAGRYPLDPATIFAMGGALVARGYRKIVLGRDTRISGPWIESELGAGIAAAGGHPVAVGVITTPGVAFLCRTLGFDAGVVISASHNPFQDNGIKVFGAGGQKLSDQEEAALEELIEANSSSSARSQPELQVDVTKGGDRDKIEDYTRFLVETAAGASLSGLRIALDCAHGAAFRIAGEVFQRLGARIISMGDQPDGANINLGCGALHPQELAELVQRSQAHVGLAFDGDADRLILVDEAGVVRDGDYVLYILGRELLQRGKLPTRTIVSTVMANLGLEVALEREGIRLLRTQVGDRHVLAAMLEGSHDLGGEQSGHTILRNFSVAGDGILTAVQVLAAMQSREKSLSELCRGFEKYPQILVNVPVHEKIDFRTVPSIRNAIEEASRRLGDRGRVLIRYSGTEPLARVMVEGPHQETIEQLSAAIAGCFRAELGVPQ